MLGAPGPRHTTLGIVSWEWWGREDVKHGLCALVRPETSSGALCCCRRLSSSLIICCVARIRVSILLGSRGLARKWSPWYRSPESLVDPPPSGELTTLSSSQWPRPVRRVQRPHFKTVKYMNYIALISYLTLSACIYSAVGC